MNLTGWLIDLYPDQRYGLTVWILDEEGIRHCLHQSFPVTFYAAGSIQQLRSLWHFLKKQPEEMTLSRTERRDLFQPQPVTVLAVQVQKPAEQPGLFNRAVQAFPDLTYYDTDIPIMLRYSAVYGVFPVGRCQANVDRDGWIQEIVPLESQWDIEPSQPSWRILSIQPDINPCHAEPGCMTLHYGKTACQLPLDKPRPLLVTLKAVLTRYDPDLILTAWGDTWLIPYLLQLSEEWRIPLPFNRDPSQEIIYRKERTYFSYGQIIYRGQQFLLSGRWHVDIYNAVMFHEYEMEGIWELARVTGLPVQTVARVSPGTGISSMQILTALRQGILVPWHKQQAEYTKNALEFLDADRGGLIYQPLVGLYHNVAEIDFVSMYPSIMARHNISPETYSWRKSVDPQRQDMGCGAESPGLIPQTLSPLLEKRISLKLKLANMLRWDPQRKLLKARTSAHKWLLVTCFGYLGYKNARFGRIEAHEAVTAYGRESLLRAKEAAEDMGYTVLHMYVDGLWVLRPDYDRPDQIQPLLEEISRRTGLPISLEGIYNWIVFLPSITNARIPVPNRYFGAYQDGSLKIRGIEVRRRDMPPFITNLQIEILNLLSQKCSRDEMKACVPQIIYLIQRQLERLHAGRVPIPDLLITQRISRELAEYQVSSRAARALTQLEKVEKRVKPGQHIRFIFTRGDPGVHAWDLPEPLNPICIDINRYTDLVLQAAATVLQPTGGMSEQDLRNRVLYNVRTLSLFQYKTDMGDST